MPLDTRIVAAAGELFKNEAFKASCEKLEERYIAQWRRTDPHQTEEREQAYRRFRALIDFLQDLRRTMDAGAAEEMAAAKKRKAAEKDL